MPDWIHIKQGRTSQQIADARPVEKFLHFRQGPGLVQVHLDGRQPAHGDGLEVALARREPL